MDAPLIALKKKLSLYRRILGEGAFARAAALYGRIRLSGRPERLAGTRYLFVLAHPRSGSTLLGHLLMNNPRILGYGENHVAYHGRDDLHKLACRTALRARRGSLAEHYVMDKIVWPRYRIAPEVRDCPGLRFVVISRAPAATFASMKRLRRQWIDEAACLRDYLGCLDWIQSVLRSVDDRSRCMSLTYEGLLEAPEATLEALSAFLELETPLSAEYAVGPTTGKLRYGDNSGTIRAGRIVRRPKRADPGFAPETLERAEARHARFLYEAETYARTVA